MNSFLGFFRSSGLFLIISIFINVTALAQTSLKVVENKRVCMVTNMVFPKDQIPVTHQGKTYYGCCENCKKTLSEDANARFAIDPVSKKSIDKATSIIAARDDGSVIYFESRKNLNKYKKLIQN